MKDQANQIPPQPPPQQDADPGATTNAILLLADRKSGLTKLTVLQLTPNLQLRTSLLSGTDFMVACTEHGFEVAAGLEKWEEKYAERGWLTTELRDENKTSTTREPPTWEDLGKEISLGKYASIHICLDEQTEQESPLLEALAQHQKQGGYISIEGGSVSTKRKAGFETWLAEQQLLISKFDTCAWGSMNKKTIVIHSNLPRGALAKIEKRRCDGNHQHFNNGLFNRKSETQLHRLPGDYNPGFLGALAQAHHKAWTSTRIMRVPLSQILIRLMQTPESGTSYNNVAIMDSGADKHCEGIGEAGPFVAIEIYGPINCEGFDSTVTQLQLAKTLTLGVTIEGESVLLESLQAVVHELKLSTPTLLDPSAMAAAGWTVEMNFSTSSGMLSYGKDRFELKPCRGGLGFTIRKPTQLEIRQLRRIIISKANYNKERFMLESSGVRIQKLTGKYTTTTKSHHEPHTLRSPTAMLEGTSRDVKFKISDSDARGDVERRQNQRSPTAMLEGTSRDEN
jgi:hypothetical protein